MYPLIASIALVRQLLNRDAEQGQGLAEYALIIGLIAIVAIVTLLFLGDAIDTALSTVGSTLDSKT